MLATFLQTLPFFGLVALGYAAARAGLFPEEATGWLTRFVFLFALPAMLLAVTATMPAETLADTTFLAAYASASLVVWGLILGLALLRGEGLAAAAIEAQCAVVGNVGFIGVPMLLVLLGPRAAGPVLMVLAVDLIVFMTLFTLLVTLARGGRIGPGTLWQILRGLVSNPMLVAIALGIALSSFAIPLPEPGERLVRLLGGAATPCALFAIGASMAGRPVARLGLAGTLSLVKLVLHPLAAAIAALVLFPVEPQAAAVMITAAGLPVASYIYIFARSYDTGPRRVSTAILLSTLASIVTLPAIIALTAPA